MMIPSFGKLMLAGYVVCSFGIGHLLHAAVINFQTAVELLVASWWLAVRGRRGRRNSAVYSKACSPVCNCSSTHPFALQLTWEEEQEQKLMMIIEGIIIRMTHGKLLVAGFAVCSFCIIHLWYYDFHKLPDRCGAAGGRRLAALDVLACLQMQLNRPLCRAADKET